jgi:hypothetical protein
VRAASSGASRWLGVVRGSGNRSAVWLVWPEEEEGKSAFMCMRFYVGKVEPGAHANGLQASWARKEWRPK